MDDDSIYHSLLFSDDSSPPSPINVSSIKNNRTALEELLASTSTPSQHCLPIRKECSPTPHGIHTGGNAVATTSDTDKRLEELRRERCQIMKLMRETAPVYEPRSGVLPTPIKSLSNNSNSPSAAHPPETPVKICILSSSDAPHVSIIPPCSSRERSERIDVSCGSDSEDSVTRYKQDWKNSLRSRNISELEKFREEVVNNKQKLRDESMSKIAESTHRLQRYYSKRYRNKLQHSSNISERYNCASWQNAKRIPLVQKRPIAGSSTTAEGINMSDNNNKLYEFPYHASVNNMSLLNSNIPSPLYHNTLGVLMTCSNSIDARLDSLSICMGGAGYRCAA